MLPLDDSAVLSTFIMLSFVVKTFVLSILVSVLDRCYCSLIKYKQLHHICIVFASIICVCLLVVVLFVVVAVVVFFMFLYGITNYLTQPIVL